MTRRAGTVVALVVLLAGTVPAPARAADESPAAFIGRLRAALASDNRRAVAAMFRYPLRVNAPSVPLPIPLDNPQSTLRMYDQLFTPEMRCAINQAQVPRPGSPAPKYPLASTGGTLTLGENLIVAERTPAAGADGRPGADAGTFSITRMTIVGSPSRRTPGVPAVSGEIDLRFAGAVRQVAGNLAGDAFDRYTISLTRGAVLQARLERFRGLDAVLRLTDSTGRPVDAKADGRRTWNGSIPESGMYRLDVVRKAPFCDPPLTYLLTVTSR